MKLGPSIAIRFASLPISQKILFQHRKSSEQKIVTSISKGFDICYRRVDLVEIAIKFCRPPLQVQKYHRPPSDGTNDLVRPQNIDVFMYY